MRDEAFQVCGRGVLGRERRPREHDRLAQALQSKREERAAVEHGVHTLQNDEAVALLVPIADDGDKLVPVLGFNLLAIR